MQNNFFTGYITNRDNSSLTKEELKSVDEGIRSDNFVLYEFLINTDASTAISAWEYQMIEEFKTIIRNSSKNETENSSSPFILDLRTFLERYGADGLDLLKTYIINLASVQDTYLISDIMEMVGYVQNIATYDGRYNLLANMLNIAAPEIRYGVILGLGNLGEKAAISILEHRLTKEDNDAIASTIRKVLVSLKE